MSIALANAFRFGMSQLLGVPEGTPRPSPYPVISVVIAPSVGLLSGGTVVSEARRASHDTKSYFL